MKSYIMLDVGGTQIKSGVLSERGRLVGEIERVSAHAKAAQKDILKRFADILKRHAQAAQRAGMELAAVGMAFPGPFDYDKGICLMKGQDKFQALYGADIRQSLMSVPACADIFGRTPFFFQNDVSSFALGEYAMGHAKGVERVLCLCIGTGAGSAFLQHGKLMTQESDGVPANGWIFPFPFMGRTVDDVLSARGLKRLAQRHGFPAETDGAALYASAAGQDARALLVWEAFGQRIAQGLLPFVERFRPHMILMGGQITKSRRFFLDALKKELARPDIRIACSEDTTASTLHGLWVTWQGMLNQTPPCDNIQHDIDA